MKPTRAQELAVLRSVVYASLFDYPLTLAQLRQTLIASAQTPSQILATFSSSEMLQSTVEYRDGFFFPRGRFDLVAERTRREARSRIFLRRHRRLLRLIAAIPYVRLAALSGSIAHQNLDARGEYAKALFTHGLAVAAAEGLAEWHHRRIRSELRLDPERGKRYSPGYSACPDLADQARIFRLLDPAGAIGVTLTSAYQLVPEASTSAIIVHHPAALYYLVKA